MAWSGLLGDRMTCYALLDQLVSESPGAEVRAACFAALGRQLGQIGDVAKQQGFRMQLLRAGRVAESKGMATVADDLTQLAARDARWLVTPGAVETSGLLDIPINVTVQDGPPIDAAIERGLQALSVPTGPDLETKYRIAAVKRERQALSVSLVPTTWTSAKKFHAVVEHDPGWLGKLPDGPWITPIPFGDSLLPGIAAVHAIIMSSDGAVIAAQRSAATSYRPLHWSVSFEEQLNEKDLRQHEDAFTAAARRGLKEEFGADSSAQDAVLLAAVMEISLLNLGLVFLLSLPMTARQLIDSWSSKAKDKWEANDVRAIPLDNVDAGMASLGQLHPTSELRWLALQRWLHSQASTVSR
jgi:hypothetical protein